MNYIKLLLNTFLLFGFIGFANSSYSNNDTVKLSEEPNADQDEMPLSVNEVIKWDFRVEQGDGCTATLIIDVKQLDHWHIYSQELPKDAVNIPTEFIFKENPNYELVGKTVEVGSEFHDEDGVPAKYFPGKKALFKQKIKILNDKAFKVEGTYSFMACKKSCFPPEFDRPFTFNIKGCGDSESTENETTDSTEEQSDGEEDDESEEEETDSNDGEEEAATNEDSGDIDGPIEFKMTAYKKGDNLFELQIEAVSDSGWYLLAGKADGMAGRSLDIRFEKGAGIKLEGKLNQPKKTKEQEVEGRMVQVYGKTVLFKQKIKVESSEKLPEAIARLDFSAVNIAADSMIVVQNTEEVELGFDLEKAPEIEKSEQKKTYWAIFLLAFVGGLAALLTPCVFPMIPMTVTFFTKQSKTKAEGFRKAFIYSLSIILIYVILGVAVSAIFGAGSLNDLSTNVYMNVAFFILFVIFAISFFGAFEITLPNSWVSKADKQADKGGLLGVFFMAFTLALVSFSCTGPIVGSVLVKSAEGGMTGPIIAMVGFSLALALPFGLFAAFPGWLNSLPQSGGWLNTVKVTLGFLELAFAFKFLSNADLVLQGHWMEREVFLAIWIGIFGALTMYLFGLFRFPHDSKMETLSVSRGMFAMITLIFTFYMLPGLWGAPLKLLSGFPPGASYSEIPYGIHGHPPEKDEDLPESAHYHGHGIWQIRDYYEGLAYAKKIDKPVLLDFTGHACVNCRKMEENVWPEEGVVDMMKNDFVVVSLFVDERTELPESEQYYSDILKGTVNNVGSKWKEMEIERYKEATQPLYAILDHNENSLNGKANYSTHGDVETFGKWLEDGLNKFQLVKDAEIVRPKVEVVK